MPYAKSIHEVKLSTFKEVTQDPGCYRVKTKKKTN